MLVRLEVASLQKYVAYWPLFGERPGVHRFDELRPGTETRLYCENAEEKITICGHAMRLVADIKLGSRCEDSIAG